MGSSQAENESAVWLRAVADDPDAFGRVFQLHADRVFGHSLRLTGSRADADDVTAMVFLMAWKRRRSVRVVDASIISWLLVTATYTARNLARSRRRQHLLLARLPPPRDSDDPTDAAGQRVDAQSHRAGVRRAFSQLSARHQDVLALCVLEDLSMAEAASALGIPVGTVKSRLARAKSRLAVSLTGVAPTPHAQPEGTA
ncbi:MAG TPA: RNA polymerase sigma factor [Acidimicrobiia bacterium]|nr:RNA polymerase sigma factor [Acidimicrobiia bacterium]